MKILDYENSSGRANDLCDKVEIMEILTYNFRSLSGLVTAFSFDFAGHFGEELKSRFA
ncbi:hypothetical protein ADE_46570 [Achromobacter denitrificans]|nr:hypothetical protein ADE_46570 [Achromobacter denitrificans]